MAEKTEESGGPAAAREEHSAGGVVVRSDAEGHHVLLIRDPYGKWGLPKGHVERREDPSQAALREVREETGLEDVALGPFLKTIDWYFRLRGRLVHKHCDFFLMASRGGEPRPEVEEGIRECRWIPLERAPGAVSYENARGVVAGAGRFLGPPDDGFPPWRGRA